MSAGSDFITACLYAWPIIAGVLLLTCVALWLDRSEQRTGREEAEAQRDQAERDRLQTEAAYRRLRAQAARRRGQDTPRTSPDPRLRLLDGGDAS